MGRHGRNELRITAGELERAFSGAWADQYPPILDVRLAAELALVTTKTIYDWSHRGLLDGCASRRGKRLRILRDRFVQFLFDQREIS